MEETNFIGTLGLNWKLFVAQLVNFGIVIFILWKWVMKPVVGALESRRARIEQSVKKAEEIERQANEFRAYQESERRKVNLEADALINKAVASGEKLKQETAESARLEARKIITDAKAAIEAEKGKALTEVREEVANMAVMAAEKILRAKLDGRENQELINKILKTVK